MTDRAGRCRAFLDNSDWKDATRARIAGDASNRSYDRLTRTSTGATAILMDAPPEKGEDIRPFIQIAQHLRAHGLSAPEIYDADEAHGFLILEDLGDDLFSQIIPRRTELENPLYAGATEVLLELRRAKTPNVSVFDAPVMADLCALAFTSYAAAKSPVENDVLEAFTTRFAKLLSETTAGNQVLILRDYHADNLLWLPDRTGPAKIGLLDFQDAKIGHCAYDLASLLQDVRRDVPRDLEEEMIARYVAKSEVDGAAFREAYYVLGAQRALRILGVFARLGRELGRPHYVDMIPKVWRILSDNLDRPALSPISDFLREVLPEPDGAMLPRLKGS
ncbi:MAG: aminoglycoside phosphotransferase family protein [Arenibacterium sp.]